MTSRILCGATVLTVTTARRLGAQAPDNSNGRVLPSDEDIRQILRQRVDVQGKGVGIVVGVVDASGARVISHGQIAEGDQRPLDGDTAFEIGSMTKVFTALALADMVRRGEVALEDPIAKYLPAGARILERNGQPITFLEVATHSSGLPLMPDGITSLNELVTLKHSTRSFTVFWPTTSYRARTPRSGATRTSVTRFSEKPSRPGPVWTTKPCCGRASSFRSNYTTLA